MIIIIVLGAVVVALIVLAAWTAHESCDTVPWLFGTGAFLMLIVAIIVLACFLGSVSNATYWNKIHDTSFTTEEWFWNGELIKGYDTKLKTEKMHLEIEGLK